MRKELLVFDFDGTIADTLAVSVLIYNEVSEEFGLEKVTYHEVLHHRGKNLRELMRLAGLSWVKLPFFLRRVREVFRRHLDEVSPVPGMPESLQALKDRGYRLGILTSNRQDSVEEFLNRNNLPLFDFVLAPEALFGKSRVLRKVLRENQLDPEEVAMIGDEVRDIEAASRCGVESVAVTWGFNSDDLLANHAPAFLARSPEELLVKFA